MDNLSTEQMFSGRRFQVDGAETKRDTEESC